MNLASFNAVAVALTLALSLPGCGEKSPEPEKPAETLPAETPGNESSNDTGTPAVSEPEGPEVIDQAAGERVNPIDSPLTGTTPQAPASTPEGDEPATPNPLTNLPGFSPSTSVPPSAAAEEGVAAGSDNVLVQVSVFELSPKAPEDLAPIVQFLGGGVQSLSPDEAAAFMEMVGALSSSGVISTVASPRMLVSSGQEAAMGITQLGGGPVNGVPTARSALVFSVAPTVRRDGGEDEAPSVDVRYELRFSEADSAFQVVAQDLGLNIGARASGAGRASVGDQRTFFFFRRVVGDGTSREMLVLVRPQVIRMESTK